jgi:hypothetical protein
MLIDLHPDLLIFMDLSIMLCGHRLEIYVMSRGRRFISRWVKNDCNIMSLKYETHILLLLYFKENVLDWFEISLVYELPNCKCIKIA